MPIRKGADDLMTEPIDPGEFLAKVKMVLRRSSLNLDANPLTKLPGNGSIMKELQSRLESGRPCSALFADIDNFKYFNDKYGFERGDIALKHTAAIIIKAVDKVGASDDFVGHIGGDDFIILVDLDRTADVCEHMIEHFDAEAPRLYDEHDREQGFVIIKDRGGHRRYIPLMSISIGVVSTEQRTFQHHAHLIEVGTKMKAYAKSLPGSVWVKDRRVNGK